MMRTRKSKERKQSRITGGSLGQDDKVDRYPQVKKKKRRAEAAEAQEAEEEEEEQRNISQRKEDTIISVPSALRLECLSKPYIDIHV